VGGYEIPSQDAPSIGFAKAIVETLAEPVDRDRPRTRASNFPPAASYARYREVILGDTV
jgi:hypothetical protein